MSDMFLIGVHDAFEKVARSNLKPLALARTLEEGLLSKSLSKKFKVSPGEMRKAQKIREHARRKAMRTGGLGKKSTEELLTQTTQRIKRPITQPTVARPTPSQTVAQRRLGHLTKQVPAPQPATVVGRPSATALPGAKTVPPPAPVPAADPARKRLFRTPASMMHSRHAPGSMGAIKHVFAAWRRG